MAERCVYKKYTLITWDASKISPSIASHDPPVGPGGSPSLVSGCFAALAMPHLKLPEVSIGVEQSFCELAPGSQLTTHEGISARPMWDEVKAGRLAFSCSRTWVTEVIVRLHD